MPIPHEISLGYVYFPPLAFAVLFVIIAAWITAGVLNRTGLSRYFWRPPVAFIGFVLFFAAVFALFIIAP